MTAFVEKTVSFNSTDSNLTGLRQAYSRMCRAFTPPPPAGLVHGCLRARGQVDALYETLFDYLSEKTG